jgi:hypothetical protein
MKTAKVVSVKGDGTFNDLYKFDVELDNGDNAKMYKKTPQHWLEEGQEINYTINEKGTLKVIREGWDHKTLSNGSGGGSSNFKKDNSVQEYIIKQSSLKCAVDVCISQGLHSTEDILSRADAFKEWVLEQEEKKEEVPFS